MVHLCSVRNTSVYALTTIHDIMSVSSQWDDYSYHPASDRYVFDLELSNLAPTASAFVLAARRNSEVVGLLVGRLEHKQAVFRLGYLPICRVKAKILAFVERGALGLLDDEIADAYLQSIHLQLETRGADFAHLASVETSSPLRESAVRVLPSFCLSAGESLERRWVIDVPHTFEDYLSTLSKKTRQRLRQHERALLRTHSGLSVSIVWPDHTMPAQWFDDVLSIYGSSYQNRLGLGRAIRVEEKTYWEAMLAARRLLVSIVYIDGRPVAFSRAHLCKKTAYFVTTGYDPEYAHNYVGEYSFVEMLRFLIRLRQVTVLDFGLGDAQYKEMLCGDYSDEGHLRIFSTCFRGQLIRFVSSASMRANTWVKQVIATLNLKTFLKNWVRRRALK